MSRLPAISRRVFTSSTILAAAALALPDLRAQQPETRKITIAVGGKAAFYYLPLTISEQLGYFKAEGLAVEIQDFPGGAKALQAVVAGSADLAEATSEAVVRAEVGNCW